MKYGDLTRLNSLSVSDSTKLWEGVLNNEHTKWVSSNSLLCDPEGKALRAIPIRIITRENPHLVSQEAVYIKGLQGNILDNITFVDNPTKTFEEALKSFVEGRGLSLSILGFSIPPETPILWLSQNLSCCDHFLYVVVSVLKRQ
jgi:hypothetical protein